MHTMSISDAMDAHNAGIAIPCEYSVSCTNPVSYTNPVKLLLPMTCCIFTTYHADKRREVGKGVKVLTSQGAMSMTKNRRQTAYRPRRRVGDEKHMQQSNLKCNHLVCVGRSAYRIKMQSADSAVIRRRHAPSPSATSPPSSMTIAVAAVPCIAARSACRTACKASFHGNASASSSSKSSQSCGV